MYECVSLLRARVQADAWARDRERESVHISDFKSNGILHIQRQLCSLKMSYYRQRLSFHNTCSSTFIGNVCRGKVLFCVFITTSSWIQHRFYTRCYFCLFDMLDSLCCSTESDIKVPTRMLIFQTISSTYPCTSAYGLSCPPRNNPLVDLLFHNYTIMLGSTTTQADCLSSFISVFFSWPYGQIDGKKWWFLEKQHELYGRE